MPHSITVSLPDDLYGLLIDASWEVEKTPAELIVFTLEMALVAGAAERAKREARSTTPWADEAAHIVSILLENKGKWMTAKHLLFRLVKDGMVPRDTDRFPGPLSRRLVRSYGVQRRLVNGCVQLRMKSAFVWPAL